MFIRKLMVKLWNKPKLVSDSLSLGFIQNDLSALIFAIFAFEVINFVSS